MPFFQLYAIALGAILIYMTILWSVSLALKNSSIVDIFWGPGFVMVGWIAFALTSGSMPRKLLLMSLVTLWGLRLGGYILSRNFGKPEDFRYQAWRQEAGAKWWWFSFFKVFALQGLLMWIISIPLVQAQFHAPPAGLTPLDYVATALWVVGFFFEAVGDAQMARFKRDTANKDKVLNTGVWRYTRHPNYFGEAVQWWAYFLFALQTPLGIAVIYSPVLMTYLLLNVSGVALLEKALKDVKPQYKKYIETTSAFIPWFPRQHAE